MNELKCPSCGVALKLEDEKELVVVTAEAKPEDAAETPSETPSETPAETAPEATPEAPAEDPKV